MGIYSSKEGDMRGLSKKLFIIFLVLFIFLLSGCKKEEVTEEIEPIEEVGAEEVVEEEIEIVEEEAEPVEEEVEEEKILSKLSGSESTEEDKLKRVLAVMLDNHPRARMHAGINNADMVFEMKVEGTYTRLLALFQSQEADRIGPIRSSRPYFIDRMYEFNSIYGHVGGSVEATERLYDKKYDNVNGMVVSSKYMWRDSSTGKKAPHNMYSSSKALRDYGLDKGYEEEYDFRGYLFNQEPIEIGGEESKSIKVEFARDNISIFTFDEDDNKYFYNKDGKDQVDENTGDPIKARNIIVQYVNYKPLPRDGSLWLIDQVGEGKGLYFSMGQVVEISWEKKDESSQTLYYIDGEEISLNPGQTWILLGDKNTKVSY